jgi:hypothetical protein
VFIESSTIVQLKIDPDGDGIVNDFQFTAWTGLQAQAAVHVSNCQEILSR